MRFRRKTKSEWTVLFVLFMPFLFSLLTDIMQIPELIKYTIDIAWVGLLISMFNKKMSFLTLTVKKLLIIVSLFIAFTTIGFLVNFQSIFFYLWGFRNTVRFFVYFFACVFFLKDDGVEHYLGFFDWMFFINVPIMLYQFFVMSFDQDNLGGIFGTSYGVNGYINILFIIVVVKSVLYCIYNKETVIRCLLKCAIALLLAALAEIKAFYIEFVVIVAIAMCFSRASYRKFWISVGSIIGIAFGVRLIGYLFPVFKDWFDFERIWRSLTNEKGYTSSNDMNRITVVSIALERFLPSLHQKLFGLGLGNCDYASYDFLITPFYKAYGGLHYVWFSSAMLILETGLIGMGLYVYFFVQIFLSCWRMSKDPKKNKVHCQMGMICSVMCGFLFILNSSLRTESGFMMYFVLALPFISNGQKKSVNSELAEAIHQN